MNYKCSPGVQVDKYRDGRKTFLLISLREVKKRGAIEDFNIQWHWKNGFLSKTGFWGTEIQHKTGRIKIEVIFPKSRPPIQAWIIEVNRRKNVLLESKNIRKLPDGRWNITWNKKKPKLFETYLLKWEW